MRLFIAVFILILNLQSWTKADDIRDFAIEGMSIGDSLLNFLRDLEYQDNIILLNDIDLSLNSQKNDNREKDEYSNLLEVNIGITFYGKN